MDLYWKPSVGNTLLHASSLHPKSLVRSIPYAQYIWIQRNCTSDLDFKKHADLLQQRLLACGYSHTLLRHSFNRGKAKSKASVLYGAPFKQRDQTVGSITDRKKLASPHG